MMEGSLEDVLSVSVRGLDVANSGFGVDKVCGTCLAHDDQNGECHRHPPAVVIIGEDSLKETRLAQRPITDVTNWCLDWVKR